MKKSKKIVAVGGGEIGRQGKKIETLKIDQEIIKLAGKKKPKLLFIPTASGDSDGYIEVVKKYFGKKLGCKISVLKLINTNIALKDIRKLIFTADIIYVGGGNTLKMLKLWRSKGVDKLLISAYSKGIILSGLSAGSVCWFKYGQSDSRKFKDKNAPYITISGLNLIDSLHCPHYDTEKDRQADLKKRMKKINKVAIALENCSAIEIINDQYKIIASKPKANAFKIYWHKNKFYKIKLEKNKLFPIGTLLKSTTLPL
ncbi:MAG: Type 1 glutamine amidotransferase-like domain-containing protein [Candidatus Falkowbacteria bacterium]